MRMQSRGPDRFGDEDGVKRFNLTVVGTEEEIVALEAMMAGATLVGCGRDGVPLTVDIHHKVDLRPDPATAKFWPWFGPDGSSTNLAYWDQADFDFAKTTINPHRWPEGIELAPHVAADIAKGLGYCISIYVHGLAGYGSDKAELERRVALMTEAGFSPMRSPRGEDGRYWEVWFLGGAYAAKGPVKGATLHEVLRWIVREVRPGSIDLVTQRLALGVPD